MSTTPYDAFIPNALPPATQLQWSSELQDLAERANRALGRLDEWDSCDAVRFESTPC